nr:MAG TPA: hypothetical protein [Caudoviricetes sp.]
MYPEAKDFETGTLKNSIKIVLFSREYGQYPVCDAIIVLNLSRSSFL